MTTRQGPLAIVGPLAAILAFGGAAGTPERAGAQGASAAGAGIASCRSTEDPADRLDCYDRFQPKREQAQQRRPRALRDCAGVADEEARLACYERYATAPPATKPPVPPRDAQEQAAPQKPAVAPTTTPPQAAPAAAVAAPTPSAPAAASTAVRPVPQAPQPARAGAAVTRELSAEEKQAVASGFVGLLRDPDGARFRWLPIVRQPGANGAVLDYCATVSGSVPEREAGTADLRTDYLPFYASVTLGEDGAVDRAFILARGTGEKAKDDQIAAACLAVGYRLSEAR